MKRSMLIKGERVSSLDYEAHFKDKVCLVTGATSGIGKSAARKLIRAGMAFRAEQTQKIEKHRRVCDNDWTSDDKD